MTVVERRRFLAKIGAAGGAIFAMPSGATCLKPAPDATAPPADARLPDVGAGQRFSADGQAQRWPGCTLLAAVRPANPMFERLCAARDQIRASSFARNKMTWMPEQSYHMTVCDLVNVGSMGRRRDWPAKLPLSASLADACSVVGAALRRMPRHDARPVRMRLDPVCTRTGLLDDGQPRTYVRWLPARHEDVDYLGSLRERVFAAVGIHHEGERRYVFHTTLSYPLAWFSADEAAEYDRAYTASMTTLAQQLPLFDLGPPDFCLFESMFLFEPQFWVA